MHYVLFYIALYSQRSLRFFFVAIRFYISARIFFFQIFLATATTNFTLNSLYHFEAAIYRVRMYFSTIPVLLVYLNIRVIFNFFYTICAIETFTDAGRRRCFEYLPPRTIVRKFINPQKFVQNILNDKFFLIPFHLFIHFFSIYCF